MIEVEIYSDVVCPWCYIGEHRFFQALEAFPGREKVEVVFRPYQLDPGAPQRAIPLTEYLGRRYGDRAQGMMSRVGAVAAEEGIAIDWDRALAGNTYSAQRMIRLALEEYGAGVQRALVERLFALHFSDGGDLTDPEKLVAEAAAAGMNPDRVRAFLDSDEGVWEIDEAFDRARALGISGVPTFVFNGQWAVQGAQRMSTFLQALEQAEEEVAKEAERTAAVAAESGDRGEAESSAASDSESCEDGVCSV